jgi:hypothetical protein
VWSAVFATTTVYCSKMASAQSDESQSNPG